MAAADAVSDFDDIFGQPALVRSWPTPKERASWPEALRLAGAAALASKLEGSAKTVQASLRTAEYPIVGVLGQLNAGKSSVVASFLSETGQSRLPRGLHDAQGTHRFVYWLPKAWRDEPVVWDSFEALLASVHGSQIEYLDDDPTRAAEQYGSGIGNPDVINRPLVAFDSGLNDQGFALLDCPDVQTRDSGVPQLTAKLNPRVDFVCKAAKLCSAFLYVWEASKLREALFADLLHTLRSDNSAVPVMLLVNKIKPSHGEPTITRKCGTLCDATGMTGIDANAIYGAFDHDVSSRMDARGERQPGWEELTPLALAQRHRDGGGHPQFFSLSVDATENAPQAVEESRFLHVVLKALPPAELQRMRVVSLFQTLSHDSQQAVHRIRTFVTERDEMAKARQNHLLDVAVKVFTDPKTKEPTQLPDPQVLAAVRESITETAPWAIRAMMNARDWTESAVTRPTKDAIATVGKTVQGLLGFAGELKNRADEAKDGFKNLFISRHPSADLAHTLMAQRWFPTGIDESHVTHAIDKAYDQVIKSVKSDPCVPPKRELDKHARHIWSRMTTWDASLMFFTTLLGVLGDVLSLGGLALLVIDGGATALGTMSIANAISSQLIALGIPAVMAAALFSDLDSSLARFNTIPAVSRLLAMLCDVFGIPRPKTFSKLPVQFGPKKNRVTYHLVDPAIPVQPVVCPLGDQSLWREEPAVEQLAQWAASNG